LRVGIVGSRRWKDREAVVVLVNELPADSVVISGGCRGVDTWAATAARSRRLEVAEYLPDLPPSGSPIWAFTKAYHARNRQIVENSDVIFAFVAPDRRGGTENTIKHARELGVRVEIIIEGR